LNRPPPCRHCHLQGRKYLHRYGHFYSLPGLQVSDPASEHFPRGYWRKIWRWPAGQGGAPWCLHSRGLQRSWSHQCDPDPQWADAVRFCVRDIRTVALLRAKLWFLGDKLCPICRGSQPWNRSRQLKAHVVGLLCGTHADSWRLR